MPMVIRELPLVDGILSRWRDRIGADYPGYRNHVCRVVNIGFALGDWSEEQRRRIVIAGCFHDIGIWSAGTADYLPPSIAEAEAYLAREELGDWAPEIALMIDLHHKITPYRGDLYPLVEIFRRADLADLSLGIAGAGLPASFFRDLKRAFPNAGFHRRLVRLAGQWVGRHPLRWWPIFKW
uniref:hypothetical protein n=1 Tax=Sphingomonas bacterium TaxID=1895847 RepID=UPI00261F22AD|nr:hypothetical protein [Sphingomonas bacterium]